jgi:hypothetical protein
MDSYRKMSIEANKTDTEIYAGAIDEAFGSLTDNFMDAIKGAQSFGDAVKNVLLDIGNYLLKMQLQKMFASLLTPLSGGLTGGAGAASGFQYEINMPTLKDLPQYDKGGNFNGGMAIINERGPELIDFGRSSGHVYTAQQTREMFRTAGSQSPGDNNRPVNVYVQTPNAQSFRQSESQVAAAMGRASQRAARRNG